MSLQQPESAKECVYFSRRSMGKGKAMAWAFRQDCPKCGREKMGKPVEDGRVRMRAKEYACPACGHTVEKEAYEDTLTLNVSYTCPSCTFSGETQISYKRKAYHGVPAFVFSCEKCGEKIPITKKLRGVKENVWIGNGKGEQKEEVI